MHCSRTSRLLAIFVTAATSACSAPPPNIDASVFADANDATQAIDTASSDALDALDALDASMARDVTDVDSFTPTSSGRAPVFDGRTGYVEIPDDDAYSASTTGEITVEAWMRPDSLAMTARESTGYVHWMGKGEPDQQEWVARMYQQGNSEGRANRISFYAFNLPGMLGAGSYFEDTVVVGEWIHYVGVIDATRTYIYKNGTQRDSDLLSGYNITPRNGTAPVRIGTREMQSFFEGSVARVAIYSARLSDARIRVHHDARALGTYDAEVMSEASLVGFWRLDETSGTVAVDASGRHDGRYVGGVAVGTAVWTP